MQFKCRWLDCSQWAAIEDYCVAHEHTCKWFGCNAWAGFETFCSTHEYTCKWPGCSDWAGFETFCYTHEYMCRAQICGQFADSNKFCPEHLIQKELGNRFPVVRPIGKQNYTWHFPQSSTHGDSWVYLIERTNQQKIGITRNPDRRLKIEHFSNGWTLIELRGPISIEMSRFIETRILQTLKSKRIALGGEIWSEKFDGYTETWSTRHLRVRSIQDLLPFDIKASQLGNSNF